MHRRRPAKLQSDRCAGAIADRARTGSLFVNHGGGPAVWTHHVDVLRALPSAVIDDEVAVDSADRAQHRELVEPAAVFLGDLEGVPLAIGRPRDDAAGVVALWPMGAKVISRGA